MKVIVIGGYPGSGKSTVMRGILKELEQTGEVFEVRKWSIVTWMESKNIIVLGSYDDPEEKFPGTDRLPMNVQPDAQKFMKGLLQDEQRSRKVVIFEGDRLFNDKFLGFLLKEGFEVILCVTFMAKHLLEERRAARSGQNETWRRGRETKVNRIALQYPVHHHLQTNTKEEQEDAITEVVREIRGQWKAKKVESKIKDMWK